MIQQITPSLRTGILSYRELDWSAGMGSSDDLNAPPPRIAQLTAPSSLHYIAGNWKQQTHPFRAVLPDSLSLQGRQHDITA
jgi:hypothetical protein